MIPHLFWKYPLPKQLPSELVKTIAQFSKTSKTNKEFLEKCFLYVSKKNTGNKFGVIQYFPKLFKNNIDYIVNDTEYAHCTTMNYLLRVMLITSGRFKEEDIKQVFTQTLFLSPHQYLKIRIAKNIWIEADPWFWKFGIDLGNHGYGFRAAKHFHPIR